MSDNTTRRLIHLDESPSSWVVDTTSGASTEPTVPDSTSSTLVGTSHSRLRSYMLPLALAAAIATPGSVRAVRRYQTSRAATVTLHVDWSQHDDFYQPAPELITNEQVRALNELLAIPYTNDHGLDYLADA